MARNCLPSRSITTLFIEQVVAPTHAGSPGAVINTSRIADIIMMLSLQTVASLHDRDNAQSWFVLLEVIDRLRADNVPVELVEVDAEKVLRVRVAAQVRVVEPQREIARKRLLNAGPHFHASVFARPVEEVEAIRA